MKKNLIIFVADSDILQSPDVEGETGLDLLKYFCEENNIHNIIYISTPGFVDFSSKFENIAKCTHLVKESSKLIDITNYNMAYQFFQDTLKQYKQQVFEAMNYFVIGLGNSTTDACLMLLSRSLDFNGEVLQFILGDHRLTLKKVFLPNPNDLTNLIDKKWLEIRQDTKDPVN